MLLKLFKGTGPGTIFLIVVTLLLVWTSAFIKLRGHFSLYFDLDPMPLYGILSSVIGTNPLPGILSALSLVSLMGFLLVGLNTSLFFINQRTLLPAVVYIILSGLFPQYQLLNPAIFAALFLMLAIKRIIEAYRVAGTANNFFDAAILIGIGSLFYADLIWFVLLVIIGISLLRTWNFKEIALSVIGFLTPYIIMFGIYYIIGEDFGKLVSTIEYNLFSKPDSYVFNPVTIVALILVGLITMVSMVHLSLMMNSKKIRSRKIYLLLIWVFIISLGIYFILPSVSVEILWIIAIPISYFLSHYFVIIRKNIIPEIFFSLILLVILMIQILYLK